MEDLGVKCLAKGNLSIVTRVAHVGTPHQCFSLPHCDFVLLIAYFYISLISLISREDDGDDDDDDAPL